MRASLLLISSLVVCLPADASDEPDCQAIVAATVAEMKAGAEDWDGQSEALVRRAAGSACVKALSGAYVAVPAAPSAAPAVAEHAPGSGPAPQDADSTEAAATAGDDEAAEKKEGGLEGFFSGFKRNEISGSPNKKPYQRKREPEEEAEPEEAPTE